MTFTKFAEKIIYTIGLATALFNTSAFAQNASITAATTTTTLATSTVVSIATSTHTFSTSTLLTKYNHFGNRGDEVLKLQSFLNKYEGEKLPTTGVYHALTRNAVKRFQVKYNITPVTGIQHVKTTAKINEIYNKDISKFVLAKKVFYKPRAVSTAKISITNKNPKIASSLELTNKKVETTSLKSVKSLATDTVATPSSSNADIKTGFAYYLEVAKSKFKGLFKGFMFLLWLIPVFILLLFPKVVYDFFTGNSNSLLTGSFLKDDLEKIEGIGPKLKSDLYEFNITSFEQLSQLSTKKIKDLFVNKYGQFHDVSIDTWKEQATLLFEGKLEQFEELVKNLKGGR